MFRYLNKFYMKSLYAFAIAVLSLASCSSVKQSVKLLGDDTWQLVGIQGAVIQQSPEVPNIKFDHAEQRISGNTGCNGFGGEYALNAKALTFSKIISTQRACLESMDTENKYMNALRNVNGYVVKDGTLLLTQDGKTLLEFKKK